MTVAGSGNADAVDFAAVDDFAITIAAGDRSGAGSFTLMPEDDDVDESDETLALSGESDLAVTPIRVTLADDDEPPPPELSVADVRGDENAGTLDFVVTLEPSGTGVSVSYATRDASAVAGRTTSRCRAR